MTTQLTPEDLADMSPTEIVEAKRSGRLAVALGAEADPEAKAAYVARQAQRDREAAEDQRAQAAGQLTMDDLRGMSITDIQRAHAEGKLAHVLGRLAK